MVACPVNNFSKRCAAWLVIKGVYLTHSYMVIVYPHWHHLHLAGCNESALATWSSEHSADKDELIGRTAFSEELGAFSRHDII